ncbi:Fe3+ hydroxamate ABC transporter substrate-binding protein [Rossellomorea vietnamensis]|uniref:Fe3+ hydroxamate ABC transporter substrate-binding protein n=1 Tax=Rossellomorea vietnamensis TaxID=218284 RepID=A0A5D4MDN3_9BACI|nr:MULTISPECIES: Fe3+ hydroxamate ABC transporter substrate-binding protein [Bacillaceae]TYR99782.1 Fe3+ hydroxamate ABC transporter substrate-binding protein [Rossellomorea vietnamensis]
MFGEKAKCSVCEREIEGEEEVYVKMRWPKRKGMTEIKAYLKNEGKFICQSCFKEGRKREV